MTSARKLELNSFCHTPNIGGSGYIGRPPPTFLLGGPGPLRPLGIDAPELITYLVIGLIARRLINTTSSLAAGVKRQKSPKIDKKGSKKKSYLV